MAFGKSLPCPMHHFYFVHRDMERHIITSAADRSRKARATFFLRKVTPLEISLGKIRNDYFLEVIDATRSLTKGKACTAFP